MSSTGFGWRLGSVTFIVLLVLVVAAGCAVTQVDGQYAHSLVPERIFIGLLAGALGAGLLSPVIALASAVVGLVGGWAHRRRTTRFDPVTSGPGRG